MGAADYVPNDYKSDNSSKPAWGWTLCDGQGSCEDLCTRVVSRASDANVEYAPGATGGNIYVTLRTANLPPNSAGTKDVATFNGGDKNLVASGGNGWGVASPLAGIGESIDVRPPFIALPYRQWVDY